MLYIQILESYELRVHICVLVGILSRNPMTEISDGATPCEWFLHRYKVYKSKLYTGIMTYKKTHLNYNSKVIKTL